jgi:hypothetical protein
LFVQAGAITNAAATLATAPAAIAGISQRRAA